MPNVEVEDTVRGYEQWVRTELGCASRDGGISVVGCIRRPPSWRLKGSLKALHYDTIAAGDPSGGSRSLDDRSVLSGRHPADVCVIVWLESLQRD